MPFILVRNSSGTGQDTYPDMRTSNELNKLLNGWAQKANEIWGDRRKDGTMI